MSQEDKDLLIKDLCMRQPYGVICNTPKGNGYLCFINQTIFGTEYGVNIEATMRDYFNDREVYIKPYLRPMSSMTEEEKKEYDNRLACMFYDEMYDDAFAIDWLLENHFDFRGLIPKGLAIEVNENNNPYKISKL